MLASMFVPKITKGFLEGLKRIADQNSVSISEVQIRLSFRESEEKPIMYQKCINWEIVSETSYKEIMDIEIDFKMEEAMVTPIICEAMAKNAMELEIMVASDFSVFLYSDGKTIGAAIYSGSESKKICPVNDLFGGDED